MAGENTVTTLNGLFKELYADSISDVKPKGLHLNRDISFVERDKMPGNEFHQPVSLTHEHGFSYANAASGAFTLNPAVAHNMKDAKIVGTQVVLRSRIDYETAARASSGGKRAFRQAMDVVVENMNDSFRKRNELDFLYGQVGLGTIDTLAGQVITLNEADWATGIWAGQEGAIINAYSKTTSTATLKEGDVTITKVDVANRALTVTGDVAAFTDDDILYFKGQRVLATNGAHNVFKGLDSLISATTGTVLNIDVASYSLWAGNQSPIVTNLAFSHVNQAAALANGKGLDEDVNLYINPEVWADLLNDEAALRRHHSAAGEGAFRVGGEGIEFFSQNGSIMIKSSRYVKLSR